jgi:hypothetical protein
LSKLSSIIDVVSIVSTGQNPPPITLAKNNNARKRWMIWLRLAAFHAGGAAARAEVRTGFPSVELMITKTNSLKLRGHLASFGNRARATRAAVLSVSRRISSATVALFLHFCNFRF